MPKAAVKEAPKTRAKRVVEEVAEAPAKKTRTKTTELATTSTKLKASNLVKASKIKEEVSKIFDPYSAIDSVLDAIEKKTGISESGLSKDEVRLSTGMLVIDLILSGGLVGGGWYTLYGKEQCGKSTAITTLMAAGLNSAVPIQQAFDYEGSIEPVYTESVLKTLKIKGNLESVFGVKDNDGNWVIKPRIRLYRESIAERFFDSLASLMRKLPDKRSINGKWYFIFDDTKETKAMFKSGEYDAAYYKKTGRYRIEAPDGNPQAIIYVDSYPAMLPESQDVDDPSHAMALQARMFSEQLKRVKGKMKSKRIIVVGVNQLREKPATMFGNPEYEPCGNAIKLFSDVRLMQTSLSLGSVPGVSGTGQIEEEPSIEGKGDDTYRYVRIRATKNKLSTPFLEGYMRIWITDRRGQGRGFCPVYDTFAYLNMTGQLTGGRKKMNIKVGDHTFKGLTWLELKALVSGSNDQIKSVCEKHGTKPFKLRDICFKQMASGKGTEMFFNAKIAGGKDEEDDSSDDEE